MNLAAATTSPLVPFLSTINQTQLLLIVALLIFIIWTIYTAILMYHWFRYSYKSRFAALVFAVHIFVSILLSLFAISGLLL